jgi:putative flippase GtrA
MAVADPQTAPSRLPHPPRILSLSISDWAVLLRASASSLTATAVDGVAYQLVLLLGWGYTAAAAAGAVIGAVTNFTMNRSWAFPPSGRTLRSQLALYCLASLLTYLGLQACLVLLIEVLHVDERLAWVPAQLIAWGAISYPLFRRVVFARPRPSRGAV